MRGERSSGLGASEVGAYTPLRLALGQLSGESAVEFADAGSLLEEVPRIGRPGPNIRREIHEWFPIRVHQPAAQLPRPANPLIPRPCHSPHGR